MPNEDVLLLLRVVPVPVPTTEVLNRPVLRSGFNFAAATQLSPLSDAVSNKISSFSSGISATTPDAFNPEPLICFCLLHLLYMFTSSVIWPLYLYKLVSAVSSSCSALPLLSKESLISFIVVEVRLGGTPPIDATEGDDGVSVLAVVNDCLFKWLTVAIRRSAPVLEEDDEDDGMLRLLRELKKKKISTLTFFVTRIPNKCIL